MQISPIHSPRFNESSTGMNAAPRMPAANRRRQDRDGSTHPTMKNAMSRPSVFPHELVYPKGADGLPLASPNTSWTWAAIGCTNAEM